MPYTNKEWVESFSIFDKYKDEDGLEGVHRSTRDEIYAGPDPAIVSDEDVARLKELGWNDYGDGSFHTFT